jgi:HEPN domain-containing protein/predicted nucleotidyltransferase
MHAVKTLDDAMLTHMSHAIRSALPVRSIHLFGSRARGDARPDSDYDILIVTWDTRPDHAARLTLKRAVGSPDPPFDLRYVTAAEFEWRRRFANTVERAAHREGVILHMAGEVEERYAVAQPWFAAGERGVRLGALTLLEGDMPDESCFHAQQAVEKYLKGYLTLIDTDGSRTHILGVLAALCADEDAAFAPWVERLDALSQYAVETRYPNGRNTTMHEARRAMDTAEDFQTFVHERIARHQGAPE